jgi:hypothetical protein
MRRLPTFLLLLAAAMMLGLSAAACGGEGESEAEKEAEAGRSEAFAPICEMTSPIPDNGLPTDLPVPGDVTFVKTEKAGPSVVTEGWASEDLDKLYDDWHERFESSDYKITFDEKEEHDAEISFEGGGQSGQVKLAAECGDEGKTYARVTSRPTG